MADLKYRPVPHNHDDFLKKAARRRGFTKTYQELGDEYALARVMLAARAKAGLTQEAVAKLMGTTKSAVSRLE
ncbi:MAG: helix-turn-helix transcriptional regulator, partial [Candidatus Hydrogenedentes bacterium]|nr:helix-turn-helix transcriptional regulator [Candidatus Hydrogenedentota bacterium]